MKLKEGYTSFTDTKTNDLHIYPIKGRKHLFDNCWCKPVYDKKNGVVHHNEDQSINNNYKCK